MPYRPCPICSGKNLRLLEKATSMLPVSSRQLEITEKYFGLHGDLIRCQNCGFTYIGEMEYIKQVSALYKEMSDEAYLQEESERRLSFLQIIKNIEKLRHGNKGKILDIGCCTGGLLTEARDRGWEVVGIDPSIWACQSAKRYHRLSVVNTPIESYQPGKLQFDAITILDVLEHVENPSLIFQKVKNILKKDGIFCLVTPNYGSLTAKILGKNWWGIRLAHLSYFRGKDIQKLCKKYKFHVLKNKTYVRYFSLYYILVRIFPFIEKKKSIKNILKNITVPLALFDTYEMYLKHI